MRTRHCHQCGTEFLPPRQPGRSELCSCGADLRVCLNCVCYDARIAEHCRDRRADEIFAQDRANCCEWFEMGCREWRPPTQDNRRETTARDALKKLLGD
jgi:hypothetical protein